MARFSLTRLVGPMLVWLATVAAGLVVAAVQGFGAQTLVPVGLVLAAPALLTLVLTPAAHRDWAQAIILLIWTGFAVLGGLLGGMGTVLLVFLSVPVIGSLFHRGRVVEGLLLAAIALVAGVLGASYLGDVGLPLGETAQGLFSLLAIAATLALAVAGLIAATDGRVATLDTNGKTLTRWREGVAGGLFEFDGNDTLVAANAQGRMQFGLDALTGAIRLDRIADDAMASAVLTETAAAARRKREPVEARVALGPSSVTGSHLDARFTPLNSGGLLLHTIDRTDEEARLESLRRSHTVAEREASDKTLFFAGVSHELRTPLNAIIGFSDMMRSRLFGPLPGKYAEYADLIHDSGQYMLDLIGDVLDLSKVEAGRYTLSPDTFDMSDVVRSSVKMVRPAADAAEAAIDVDLPDDDALLVTADRKAVRQILLNLLSNAVKFSPKGGRVGVSARPDGDDLVLTVSDQGPGMSTEELKRVGEPYAQGAAGLSTDARGSGLGLSLVRQLAELHGGRLEMDSQPGEGTTARVVIPAEL